MFPELNLVKEFIYDRLNFNFSNFKEETESQAYSACTFLLNDLYIKFRTAKITPTKEGHFVTLWKRNEAGITCPHEDSDPFDFYVIGVGNAGLAGQFVFPKSALVKKGILSTSKKEGKRGFRVYAPWEITKSKQAFETQKWQSEFFLDITDTNTLDVERIRTLYTKRS